MTTATWTGRAPKELKRADNVETAPRISEDWLSLIIGLSIFVLALAASSTSICSAGSSPRRCGPTSARRWARSSKAYASLGGVGALVATYVALLAVLSAAAVALKSRRASNSRSPSPRCSGSPMRAGSSATIANFAAVTPAELQKFGIGWSLRLTNEGGYIFALLAGLIIANVFPRFADGSRRRCGPSSTSRSRS